VSWKIASPSVAVTLRGRWTELRGHESPAIAVSVVSLHLAAGSALSMNVVFSRKGFDSGWGGVPSPVLDDGRMVSLPIPDRSGIAYSELHLDGERTYADLMRALGITTVKYPINKKTDLLDARAHLDPDVVASVMTRRAGWRPMFGQVGAAQGHLRRRCVGRGDLLLFYGWFSPTRTDKHGDLRFAPARERI
jgi:hypothetical protein